MNKKRIVIIGNSVSPHVLNRLNLFGTEDSFSFFLFDTNLISEIDIPIPRLNRKIPKYLNLPGIGLFLKLLRSIVSLLIARPDVIFIMYCSKLSLLYTLLFRGKVVLSFWGGDLLNRSGNKKSFLLKKIQKKAILKADRIYCVSKELIEEVNIVSEGKLLHNPRLLMYGLDLNLYNNSGSKLPEIQECVTIFSPRWSLPLYNIETIIDAVILLLKSGEKVRLIYRDIYIDDCSEAAIYSAKLAQKIKFSGFENKFQTVGLLGSQELIKLYQNANIVISVSHYDGTPLSILESMACKTLTVCGKIPSTNNFIEHGVNGYLVNKDDFIEIANQLAFIIKNNNLQKDIIENARIFVEQNADINLEVADYIKCFNEV
jgi:glycosyltransferase involved in cell wall biosynthesis